MAKILGISMRLMQSSFFNVRQQNSRILFQRFIAHRQNYEGRNEYDQGNFEQPLKRVRINEALVYLEDKISSAKLFKKSDWDEILRTTLEKPSSFGISINKINLTWNVVNSCATAKNFQLAQNFIEYLESGGEEINTGTINAYLKLCTSVWPESKEENIIKYYDKLKKRLPVMDVETAYNLINAICLTSRWKESAEILEMLKTLEPVRVSAYTAMVSAAFRNKEVETGWSWLQDAALTGRFLSPDLYGAWLQYCAENEPTLAGGETLLDFLNKHSIIIGDCTADDLKQYYELVVKPPWRAIKTTVKPSGSCLNCQKVLSPMSITEEEFNYLRSRFFERVICGRDVFAKSNPKEILSFNEFLESSKPFDVVIDGLNVAYSAGTKGIVPPIDLLWDAVEHFRSKNMKVVIIGRIHMLKWSKRKMDEIRRKTKMFLAENISQDDPFLLYTAMHGGINTYFVSRDFMRSHKFLLGDVEARRIFKKWQHARQYNVFGSIKNRKVNIYPPALTLPFAQKTGETWHVPFEEQNSENVMFAFPKQWLCIKQN